MYNNNKTDNLDPKGVLSYSRKSRTDDPDMSVDEVLAKHASKLREWTDRNLSAPIPPENQYKELVSGESISERSEFRKLLKRIESPDIKAVLVVDLARLGRPDTAEIGLISKIFRFTNTLVITPERTFNIADDFEREMFESELKRGNFYLESTKKQLRRGREISAKSGNYLGSKPPYGYDKTTITEGKRRCPTLAINEEQARVVRNIFEWYVYENIGTQRISNRLNDLGIKSPKGLLWTADSIRDVLENIHYIGKTRWNQRKGIYVVQDGAFHKTRPKCPEEEVIISEGRHEAIISEELFYAAQEKRGRTHKTCDNKELRNPFATLMYCECGRAMVHRHSTRGNLQYRDPRLVCNGQRFCGTGSCSVPEITNAIVGVLRQKIADFDVDVTDTPDTSFHEKHLSSLEKKLSDLAQKEIALWEAQLDKEQRVPPHIFTVLKEKLANEREELEAAIRNTKKVMSVPVNREKARVSFQAAVDALLDDRMSATDKNNVLKGCIERITYHRDAHQKVTGKGNGREWIAPPISLDVALKL